jgi:hypothetical protein
MLEADHQAPGFPCALIFREGEMPFQLGRDPRREIAQVCLDLRRGADRRAAGWPMQEGDRCKCAEP